MRSLQVNVVEGRTAPRYDDAYEVKVERVAITEQATEAGLPIVDFVAMVDGKRVLFVLTGREVCAVAACIRGINQRIHGEPEP